ncbi:uncharacterized protein LOC119085740 [Bradysia coprophila]|uniref:uncharacterized protein LOC119085740 n=1 Tax=Bradysia coprophila TaxID=38358 RepID=UPI00187D7FDE|nr:uncharacterized protein LOC119085740 [Bradysia coprophila]
MTANRPESETNIFNIFDNAITDNILKSLPLNDLLRCSQTCKRLRTTCEHRFRQTFRKKAEQDIHIKLADNGKLSVSSLGVTHLKCFDNIIKNLTISSWNFVTNTNLKLENLTNFMLKKCETKLRKICIIGDMELDLFGQKIESILCNVQTVEFGKRRGVADEVQFLTHCTNLKKLILGSEINSENVDEILRQRYHRLTQFCYLYDNGNNLNLQTLKLFFRNNDRIKSIEWKFRMIDHPSRQHFVKCLQTVGYAEHLTHFRLCFSNQLSKYTSKQFDQICNQLNLLCKRDTFKILEISLIDATCYIDCDYDNTSIALSRMKSFAKWKQLSKIHLQHFGILTTMPVISEFVHLKSIVFNSCFLKYDNELVDEGTSMSQISEVVIKNSHFNGVNELCMPLVRHWANLTKIFLPICVTYYGFKLDIAELNRAREELNDACELTIFTNHKSFPSNMEHRLVKLHCDLNR